MFKNQIILKRNIRNKCSRKIVTQIMAFRLFNGTSHQDVFSLYCSAKKHFYAHTHGFVIYGSTITDLQICTTTSIFFKTLPKDSFTSGKIP